MRSIRSFRRLLTGGISVLLAIPMLSAQEVLKIEDQGEVRSFVLVEDEVLLIGDTENSERLRDDVQTAISGATVLETHGREALTKLDRRVDRQRAAARLEPMQQAAPEFRSQPVLYPEGVVRTSHTRRYVGPRVLVKLEEGQTLEELQAATGASEGNLSPLPGHALLTFRDGWQSLAASENLEARGTNARPLLRRYAERMWVPNDPYFPNQWHVKNRGQAGGGVGMDANLIPAWDMARGAGVTVVVVDDSLQTTHPDLSPNTSLVSSGLHFDFRSNDTNPAPTASDDAHGTAVAGVIAARGNNGVGVTGAAPEAQLIGIRLIGGYFDAQTAYDALTWQPAGVTSSVSNNSWGYGGVGMFALDPLERQALQDAATTRRNGLGQVTLFAAANNDSVFNGFVGNTATFTSQDANYQPYANSRFVIGVAACTNFGDHSYYSNRGASVLISAPSNGGSLGIVTTDNTGGSGYNGYPGDNNYTNSFGGTSSATPLTSGIVALMLEANPGLGYRDVQEILAATARQIDAANPDWKTNGAGYHFAHAYGAGMVDAAAAVARSKQWTNLAPSQTFNRTAANLPAAIPDNNTTGISQTFDFSSNPNLRLEHVEVVIRATHANRSDLEIILTSPDGTQSILNPVRPRPDARYSADNDQNIGSALGGGWVYMTTHNWGENSSGTWTLRTRDLRGGSAGTLESAQVRIYGTPSVPQRVRFVQKRVNTQEGAGTVNLVVERLGPINASSTVSYAVAGGTATSGADFVLANGILNFNSGERTKNIPVSIVDDDEPEAAESIFVVLNNPLGTALGGSSLCAITIAPSDGNFVSVSAVDGDAAETDGKAPRFEVPNPGVFAFTRLVADDAPLTVPFTISGTATRGSDYTMPDTVTIPAGLETVFVNVTPIDDGSTEGNETVTVTLTSNPGQYFLGDPSEATVTIRDNEIPEVSVLASTQQISESATTGGTITITRGATSDKELIVDLLISGSAEAGLDYVALPATVTIPVNAADVVLPLQPKDNDFFNLTRTVTVAIAARPEYSQGLHRDVTVRILNDEAAPDPKQPAVTITTPKRKERINATQSSIVATGTAKDNLGVSRVLYRVNGGEWFIASLSGGGATWSAELSDKVVPGPNTVEASAEDADGNVSPLVMQTFTVVQPRTLTVSIAGPGTVKPGSGTFEAGQVYKLTAKPQKGQIFAGWSGDLSASSKVLLFTMPDADTAITATFVPNPFAESIIGKYSGLIVGPTAAPETTGLLEIMVSKTGKITGKVWLSGKAYNMKGEFSGEGRFEGHVPRPKMSPILVNLQLDLDPNGSKTITGTVTGDAGIGSALAHRTPFDAKKNPLSTDLARSYTFYLPPNAPTGSFTPQGHGVGTMKVTTGGAVKWIGTLPDGSPAAQSTTMSAQMDWPLYVALYKGVGSIAGVVQHDPAQLGSDLSASLNWVKPPIPTERYFPEGFWIEDTALLGVNYTPPAKGQRVLPAYDAAVANAGPLSLKGGNLPEPGIAKVLTLSTANKVSIAPAAADKLSLSIKVKTGLVTGKFVYPLTRKSTPIRGVILQGKIGKGVGFFPGSTLNNNSLQTGRLEFAPINP